MNKARKMRELKRLGDPNLLWDVHEYQADILHRELWLVGEPEARDEREPDTEPGVEYSQASRIAKNLRVLANISDEPVLIHMKTCGGDCAEGLAIYDAIRLAPFPVTILSYTHARSMSSIILQATDKRVLMPHSYFMFHRGDAIFQGEARAVESNVEFHKRWDTIMLDIYVDAMIQSKHGRHYKSNPKIIRILLEKLLGKKVDVFLTAQEAVAWGLADEIFDGNWEKLR